MSKKTIRDCIVEPPKVYVLFYKGTIFGVYSSWKNLFKSKRINSFVEDDTDFTAVTYYLDV